MSDLPPGWEWATLGEIGNYINGRAFKESDWSTEGRPIVRIQNLTGTGKKFHHFSGVLDENHIARSGDLLISWAATLGSYVWRGPEAAINQHIFKVRSKIDVGFHYHLVDHLISQLYSRAQGSGIVHVTRGKFENLDFILPPLAEQRRIVASLEDHLSRLSAGESYLRTVKKRIASAFVAYLGQMIKSVSVGKWTRLGDLSVDQRYGTSVRCSYERSGSPVLRIPNVHAGRIDLSDMKYASAQPEELGHLKVCEGDILFVRTNGSKNLIGRSAVADSDLDCAFASYLIRYRFDASIVQPQWLQLALNSPQLRSRIETVAASSAGQYNLSISKLSNLEVPLPSMKAQSAFVHQFSELRTSLERLSAQVSTTQFRADRLRRALLADAFAGRLVPQDPGDEPASVLLERIRAERAAQPKPKRARRTKQTGTTQEALL
jgi:type I restriction enzyme S subunit